MIKYVCLQLTPNGPSSGGRVPFGSVDVTELQHWSDPESHPPSVCATPRERFAPRQIIDIIDGRRMILETRPDREWRQLTEHGR